MATDEDLWIWLVPDQDYLLAIGQVVVQWAYFEAEFDKSVAFMRMDPKVRALYDQIPRSFERRLDLFKDSAKAAFSDEPELVEYLRQIRIDARTLKEKRDLLAHAQWAGEPQDGGLYAQLGNERKEDRLTVPMMKTWAIEISVLARRTMRLNRLSWRDEAFPLKPAQESAVRTFARRNAPKLPKPGKFGPPPQPFRE